MKILLQIDDRKARTWRERLEAEFPDDDLPPGTKQGLAPLIVKAVDIFVLGQILMDEPITAQSKHEAVETVVLTQALSEPATAPSKRKTKAKDANPTS